MTQPVDDPDQGVGEGQAVSVEAASPRRSSALVILAVIAGYAALLLSAVTGARDACCAFVLLTGIADALTRRDVLSRAVLARGQFGFAGRAFARDLCVIALLLAVGHQTPAAVMLASATGMRTVYFIGLVLLRQRVSLPIVTKNVDTTGLRLPIPPPEFATRGVFERLVGVDTAGLLVLTALLAAHVPGVVIVAAVLLAAFALADLGLVVLLARGQRTTARLRLADELLSRVKATNPVVMLYFSGSVISAFQVNMWLTTLDRLDVPCVVLLRERSVMEVLDDTKWPVVCVPSSVTLMASPILSVRVAMYVVNVGKNIHMIREPGVCHVFIGHGDSDKSGSFSPVSKTFTQVWVAGQVGRERYHVADVGVNDEDIVEVGRPQLDGISTTAPRSEFGYPTVLYAPTWEGWNQDPQHTSLLLAGPALIRALLGHPSQPRIIYRPHPLTGSVAKSAEEADRLIRDLLEVSNQERGLGPAVPPIQPNETVDPARFISRAHLVASADLPTLYGCFDLCDVLVADVSSVVSDFLASMKPLVVPNMTDLDDATFRLTFASAAAAYLVGPAGQGFIDVLDKVLSAVPGEDPYAQRRRETKLLVLGPDEPDAMTRFTAAVVAAHRMAVSRWPVRVVEIE